MRAPGNVPGAFAVEQAIDELAGKLGIYGSVDAAFAGQNVYLYCASEGLATVFRGAVDDATLGRALRLPEQQFVAFAQTVGYPQG